MNRLAKLLFALSLSVLSMGIVGCKEKVVTKPDPQTAQDLKTCRDNLDSKKKLITDYEQEIADLKLKSGAGGTGEILVKVDGDVLSIVAGAGTGPNGGTGEPTGNAKDEKLYEAFVQGVRESRGSIKQCYQNALKKNSALQARTLSLNISVGFTSSGKMTGAKFSPRVSDNFDACMTAIAKRWTLPASPRSVSFETKLTLTPE
jgi:hypothetical protein